MKNIYFLENSLLPILGQKEDKIVFLTIASFRLIFLKSVTKYVFTKIFHVHIICFGISINRMTNLVTDSFFNHQKHFFTS